MATYWKSVPRKFCEFCKCWITDNKPSVDYHERGKRHQESVKKRIEEVKKKSLEKARKDEEMETDMKKMEQAAMAAFKKDLQDNPELAAKYLAKAKAAKEVAEKKDVKSKQDVSDNDEVTKTEDNIREWYEAKSPEGYSYYWSAFTGASIWEAPESFVSLEEQDKLNKTEDSSSEQVSDFQEKTESADPPPAEETSSEPFSNPLPVEDIPLPADSNSSSPADIPLPAEKPPPKKRDDPQWARRVYGTWETVHEKEPPQIDLQLPNPETVHDIPLPDPPQEKPKERFKEKKVTSLGVGTGAVAFKKRKLASGARNVRQRDGED